MCECLVLCDYCFKFKICKLLSSNVQEGYLRPKLIAYGHKVVIKVTFP